MNIICSKCRKAIGVQEPLTDLSEVKAKCVDCAEKDKIEASRFQQLPKSGETKTVVLENGLDGTLWVAETESDKLSVWELAVAGRRFLCAESAKEDFQKHLDAVPGDKADVSFLHSLSIKIPPPQRGRKKKAEAVQAEDQKDNSIGYNCTMTAPKVYVQRLFDSMTRRLNKFLDIVAESSYKAYKEEEGARWASEKNQSK